MDGINIKGIFKAYGAIRVLEDVSVDIDSGEVLCVVGPSGCGKSTFLKILALITMPDAGSMKIGGTDVASMNQKELENFRRKKIAYSFQEPLLLPYLSAFENIACVVGAPRDIVVDVMKQFRLGNRMNHTPTKLSVGEKKRVDIARALLRNTDFLITDEPLSNLDPGTSEVVMMKLMEYASRGKTVVYSSVEPAEARYADKVLNMLTSPHGQSP